MKTEEEISAKIAEMSKVNALKPPDGMSQQVFIGCKVGAIKALLWALGINDDDRYHISARPGKPIKIGRPS